MTLGNSPREALKTTAKIMLNAKAAPASGVSQGRIFVIAGNTSPSPPATSSRPMKRTNADGKSLTQGINSAKSVIGKNSLKAPIIMKKLAKIP